MALLLRGDRLLSALRRRQRQPGSAAHDVSFLGREHPFEPLGIDHLFALSRGHSAQVANCCAHHAPPVRRKLLHLPEDLPSLLFLVGGQMLPGFHAVQHALLLLRRQIGKMLQPLPELLLMLWRQPAELGIALQSPLLLIGRHIFVTTQPVARVAGLSSCILR